MKYTPYRVLHPIIIHVDDADDAILCYPHGKVVRRDRAVMKVQIQFSIGTIDAPTEEEVALFNIPAVSVHVKPIPQDHRGFDKRGSGLARSFEGSAKGRERGVIESFEREPKQTKSKESKKKTTETGPVVSDYSKTENKGNETVEESKEDDNG